MVSVAVSVRTQIDFIDDNKIQAIHMNYHIQNVLSRYLKKTNISVNKDLKTDEYLKTSLIDIYAAGDVTGISSIWLDVRMMGAARLRTCVEA